MLKDHLLNWCRNEFEKSNAGFCDCSCNNKEYCHHNCQECLNQVHWYPTHGGRSDYDCPNLLLNYVLHYTDCYSQQISEALKLVDISRYPYYNIFSIGCGAAPDLMAFEDAVDKDQDIYYKGYDRNPLWEPIHDRIDEYTSQTAHIETKLCREDIFDVFAEGKPAHKQYNIVIIQYLLSHLYNNGQYVSTCQLFQHIIHNIIVNRPKNSPFLIIITDIDSCHKGRSKWHVFLDMLEEAGCCGQAYARSTYPQGDLGQDRWRDWQHMQSPSYGNISYEYLQIHSGAAQLIIELE